MEYKFASDYAREIGQQIQGDVDRIVQQRRQAADRAREQQRYSEQQARYARSEERQARQDERQVSMDQRSEDRYNEQLYGYTKNASEAAPTGVGGWAVEGLQMALDEFQRASTQHKLEPTSENLQSFQQSKAQYEQLKNISTAKFAMNSQTITNVRAGKINNLAGGVDLAEQQWDDYSQAPEWVMSEDGKLSVVTPARQGVDENGMPMEVSPAGLTDWRSTRWGSLDDVYVPSIKAEETAFSSPTFSKTLFDETFNAKRKAYTKLDGQGLGLGELESEPLYGDITDAISDRVRTNPQMYRQMSFEQWKRDNPGKDYMTEADQQAALSTYDQRLANTAIDRESISSGRLNENGEFVFNVSEGQIDAIPTMNSEQKRAMKQWRTAVGGYYESMAQGIAGRMEPVDQRDTIARLNQNRANAEAEAEAGQQEAVNEALGATYAVGQTGEETIDRGQESSVRVEEGYSVSLPVRENVRVDLGGAGRVNVTDIIYRPDGTVQAYRTMVPNDVITAALKNAGNLTEEAQIKAFFSKYQDSVIVSTDTEFESIQQSIVNDAKIAARLKFVPDKIRGHSAGLGNAGLNQTGIDQDVLTQLQTARQQATDLLTTNGVQ